MTDLISGQLAMAVHGRDRSGARLSSDPARCASLAVTSPKHPPPVQPEIPTAAEAGLPGLVVTASLGLARPGWNTG